MKRRLAISIYLIIFVLSSCSCLALSERQKSDYGVLESAVTFASDKVIGEYGDNVPDDFDSVKFLILVKDKIPADYYKAFKKHQIKVSPKRTYYLLEIYDKTHLILFDYSCTPEIDGTVLVIPEKYDLQHLELYDKCK